MTTLSVPATPRGFGGGEAGVDFSGAAGLEAADSRCSLAANTSPRENVELGPAWRPANAAFCAGGALVP